MRPCTTCGREMVFDPSLSAELDYDEYACPSCQKEFEERREEENYVRYAAEIEAAEAEAAEEQRRLSESAEQ